MISGAAGTGKTEAMAMITNILFKELNFLYGVEIEEKKVCPTRILITAVTNLAVQNMHDRIVRTGAQAILVLSDAIAKDYTDERCLHN